MWWEWSCLLMRRYPMSALAEPRVHHGCAELLDRARPGSLPVRGAAAATDDAILITFLRSRDIPCPSCSYNLRGLRSSACPECGAPLSLHVGSPRIALG